MGKTMQVPARRFLFLSRRKGALAPLHIALLGVLALGMLGLLAVAWVPTSDSTPQRPADGRSTQAGASSEGRFIPPAPPKPQGSGTWM